jgi:hypothetical protein
VRRDDFTLFFSLPLDTQDWQNLQRSRVRRVMLPFQFADGGTLTRLGGMGIGVVLRIDESDYYALLDGHRLRSELDARMRAAPGVVRVVQIGVEPENGLDFRYTSPDWAQDLARRHAAATERIRRALETTGVQLITAGWTMPPGGISENDPPRPGRVVWREETRWAYAAPSSDPGKWPDIENGFHLYGYGWESWVDLHRVLWALKEGQELFHRPLWIDEVGIIRRSAVDSMYAYLCIATVLLGQAGARVKMLCPFVSNGDPYVRDGTGKILFDAQGKPRIHWRPEYLLRDPVCYDLVARFMAGEDFRASWQ